MIVLSYYTTCVDPVIATYQNLNADLKLEELLNIFIAKFLINGYKELINLLSYVNAKNK